MLVEIKSEEFRKMGRPRKLNAIYAKLRHFDETPINNKQKAVHRFLEDM